MKTNYEKVKDWRRNTKLRMVASFGGKCGICDYDTCVGALEFHHINPEKKEFSFNSKCRSWKNIVIELRKCVMLCCNCHREVHNGVVLLPNDIMRFDESYTNYIPDILTDECPVCNKIKPLSQITCSKQCAGKHKSKVNWDEYNLVELYNDIGSYAGVARYIGNVSDVTVKKRIKKMNMGGSSN